MKTKTKIFFLENALTFFVSQQQMNEASFLPSKKPKYLQLGFYFIKKIYVKKV
jgi:hypothetical protein